MAELSALSAMEIAVEDLFKVSLANAGGTVNVGPATLTAGTSIAALFAECSSTCPTADGAVAKQPSRLGFEASPMFADGTRSGLGVFKGSTSLSAPSAEVDSMLVHEPLRFSGFGLFGGAKDGVLGMGGRGSEGGAEGGGTRILPGLARPLKLSVFGVSVPPRLPLDEKADNAVELSASAAGRALRCLPTAFARAAS